MIVRPGEQLTINGLTYRSIFIQSFGEATQIYFQAPNDPNIPYLVPAYPEPLVINDVPWSDSDVLINSGSVAVCVAMNQASG
jgi:hypothetical protein